MRKCFAVVLVCLLLVGVTATRVRAHGGSEACDRACLEGLVDEDDGTWKNTSLRLTWQASRANKVNFWWDEQWVCLHCNEGGETAPFPLTPEAAGRIVDHPQQMGQVTWNFTPTTHLALEAGYGLGPRVLYGGTDR